MAENNAVETQALPDDGPWSQTWDKLAQGAGNVVHAVADTATSALEDLTGMKMPWEMSGGDLSKVTANKRDLTSIEAPAMPQQASQTAPVGFEDIFRRLVGVESNGKHTDASGQLTTSPVGAKGITQVMPKTGDSPGFGVTPLQDNSQAEYMRFGRDYLTAMMKHFSGDKEQAVAAYNAGPGTIEKAVAKAERTGGDWKQYIPTETRKYITKILGNTLAAVTGSTNANASADFNPYLQQTSKTETGSTVGNNGKPDGGKWVTDTNALGKQVVSIIQKDFPDHIDAINTKVSGDKAEDGALASYGGLGGDKINLGKVVGDSTDWFDKNGKPSKNNQPLPTSKVNEALATTLHEIQHARMNSIGRFDDGLGKDWKQMLDEASDHNFPSVGKGGQNGDSLNEFLATATTIKEMQRRGYAPTGRYAEPASALATMEHKYPWLKQYVINYIYPEAMNSANNREAVETARKEKSK